MSSIGKDITFAGFAALVVVPVLLGYFRRAPGMTTQWLLLVSAMVLGAAANAFERLPFDMPSWHGTAVGAAKGIVNFILLAAAIGVVFHRGRNNLGSLIDAALVAVALGGLRGTSRCCPARQRPSSPPARRSCSPSSSWSWRGRSAPCCSSSRATPATARSVCSSRRSR